MSPPAPLAAGSRVVVVAPAGPADPARLERGLQRLRGRGLRVELRFPRSTDRYLAGPDAERRDLLVQALTEPGVDAVWAARGGYGVMRLLPGLPWERITAATPRWVLGFSDLTALLLPLAARCPEWIVVHAPNVTTLDSLDAPALLALDRVLAAPRAPVTFRGLRPLRAGTVTGRLIGGNLCLLASLAGSASLPPATGRVVFLEEVGERPYRLDRMLTQLQLAGWLSEAAGVVVGELKGCDQGPLTGEETVATWLRERMPHLPAAGGLPVGHGASNHPLRQGATATLDAGVGTLSLVYGDPSSDA